MRQRSSKWAPWAATPPRGSRPPFAPPATCSPSSATQPAESQNLADAGFGSLVTVLNEPALEAIPNLCRSMQRHGVGLVFLDAKKSECAAPLPPLFFCNTVACTPRISSCWRILLRRCVASHAAAAVARIHSSLSGRLGRRGQLPRHPPRLD